MPRACQLLTGETRFSWHNDRPMRFAIPRQAIQEQQAELSDLWFRRYLENCARVSCVPAGVSPQLTSELLKGVVSLIGIDHPVEVPTCHCADVLARSCAFPESVSVCIELMQAGAQVIGAFVVENSGPTAAWNKSVRNQLLGELDAVFQILSYREIQALCDDRGGLGIGDAVASAKETNTNTTLTGFGITPAGTFHRN
jgi:hypothetical protein